MSEENVAGLGQEKPPTDGIPLGVLILLGLGVVGGLIYMAVAKKEDSLGDDESYVEDDGEDEPEPEPEEEDEEEPEDEFEEEDEDNEDEDGEEEE